MTGAADVLSGAGAAQWAVEHGDAFATLRTLPDASVDALVTDPPAGISFMGVDWDSDKGGRNFWIASLASTMREALRVLKPGAHGLVWALPRTSHWTATALEDAGFEIRDVVTHLHGQGFPKNRATALKPAAEHWILVRKPLDGTIAETVARWGTGALGIEACRVGTSKTVPASASGDFGKNGVFGAASGQPDDASGMNPNVGRWPANVVLSHVGPGPWGEGCREVGTRRVRASAPQGTVGDWTPKTSTGTTGDFARRAVAVRRADADGFETTSAWSCVPGCPVAELDAQSGATGAAARASGPKLVDGGGFGARGVNRGEVPFYGDTGGASRFFYCAKPSTEERVAGTSSKRPTHPTVKSIDLMRWLCRLVTPAGGAVLDPFAGTGTTGCAAVLEHLRFIGIEREAEHVETARQRIAWWERDAEAAQVPLFAAAGGPGA